MARVRAGLPALIDFRQINLHDASRPAARGVDVIMCRNVLIYFDAAAQARVLTRFADTLGADGLLITGHSENIAYGSDRFVSIGPTSYRLSRR